MIGKTIIVIGCSSAILNFFATKDIQDYDIVIVGDNETVTEKIDIDSSIFLKDKFDFDFDKMFIEYNEFELFAESTEEPQVRFPTVLFRELNCGIKSRLVYKPP